MDKGIGVDWIYVHDAYMAFRRLGKNHCVPSINKKYRDMEEFFIAGRKVALCMFVIAIAMTGFFILIGYLLTRNL